MNHVDLEAKAAAKHVRCGLNHSGDRSLDCEQGRYWCNGCNRIYTPEQVVRAANGDDGAGLVPSLMSR